jgi:HSP20 family protein
MLETQPEPSEPKDKEKEKEKENEKEKEGAAPSTSVAIRRPVTFRPRCDVEETEAAFIIRAELPGMEKEKINIDFNEETNELTISGQRTHESEEKKETPQGKFHRIERSYGAFSRTFRVPDECVEKMGECTAASKDGVLEVVCPKSPIPPKPEKKVRQIAIS